MPARKTAASKAAPTVRTEFRFQSPEHYDLVHAAARYSGMTMNGWLIRTTLRAARRELAEKKRAAAHHLS